MPFQPTNTEQIPAYRTQLVQSDGSLFFAFHNGRGRWLTVPYLHEVGQPGFVFSKTVQRPSTQREPEMIDD